MRKAGILLASVVGFLCVAPGALLAMEGDHNGFFLKPVGVYSGMITSTEDVDVKDGLGGGLALGANFARSWVAGIEGGLTYTSYSTESARLLSPFGPSGVPDKMEIIDLFFGGIFGGTIAGRVDLYADIGIDFPIVNFDGWDPYLGVKVGGGGDVWILDWLAVGVTGKFVWAYSLGDVYDISGSGDLDHMSRYVIQFGPKFKF